MGAGRADDRAVVTSTWELSLDSLKTQGVPQARPLLRILSCLAPAVVIPPGLLDLAVLGRLCGHSEDRAAEGLAALAGRGLISILPGPQDARPGAMVHPLVAETSLLHLDDGNAAEVGTVAVGLLATACNPLHAHIREDWPAWLQLVPHLNAVCACLASRLTGSDLAGFAEVSRRMASALGRAGDYPAAKELVRSALERAARLGADHEQVIALRHGFAWAEANLGNYVQAEREIRDVLAAQLQTLSPDDADVIDTRLSMACFMTLQGKYDQAEPALRVLLSDAQRRLGPDDDETLEIRHEIAHLFSALGRYEEAEQEYRHVVTARLATRQPDDLNVLAGRHEIARMLSAQGQHERAEQQLRDVLAARRRALGPDHRDTLVTRAVFADVLSDLRRYDEAELEFQTLLLDMQRILGPDHPDTLGARLGLARLLARRGNNGQAEQTFRDVLAASLRVLGPDHPITRAARKHLTTMQSLGRPHQP
jgi:tetratricopeptide (TPR) repeat protein